MVKDKTKKRKNNPNKAKVQVYILSVLSPEQRQESALFRARATCMHEREWRGCKERVRQSYLRETLTKDNDGNSAPQENRGQNTYK